MSQRPRIYFSVPKRHAFGKQLEKWDAEWTAAAKAIDALAGELKLPPKSNPVFLNAKLVGFTANPVEAIVKACTALKDS